MAEASKGPKPSFFCYGFLAEFGGGQFRLVTFDPPGDFGLPKFKGGALGQWYRVEIVEGQEPQKWTKSLLVAAPVLETRPSSGGPSLPYQVAVPIIFGEQDQFMDSSVKRQEGVFYSPVLQCEGQLGFALETMQFKDKCLYEAFVSLTSFNDPIDSDGDDDLNICESKSKKSTLIWSIANTRDVIGPWDDDKRKYSLSTWFPRLQLAIDDFLYSSFMRSDLNIGPIPSVGTSGVGRAEAATIDWTFSAEQVPLSNSPFPQDVEVVAGAGAVCGNGRESVTQMAQTADGCSRRSDKETVGQKLQKGVQQTPKLQIPKPKGQSIFIRDKNPSVAVDSWSVSSESDDPEDGEIVEDTAKTPNFGMGPEKEEASILQLNQTASNSKAHVPTRGGFGFRDQIVRNDGESSSNNMTRGDDWRRGRGAQLGTSASIPLPQQESPGKIEEEEGNNPYEMISTDKKTVIKVVTSVREKMAVCRKVQGKCAWFMLYERGTFVECRQTLLSESIGPPGPHPASWYKVVYSPFHKSESVRQLYIRCLNEIAPLFPTQCTRNIGQIKFLLVGRRVSPEMIKYDTHFGQIMVSKAQQKTGGYPEAPAERLFAWCSLEWPQQHIGPKNPFCVKAQLLELVSEMNASEWVESLRHQLRKPGEIAMFTTANQTSVVAPPNSPFCFSCPQNDNSCQQAHKNRPASPKWTSRPPNGTFTPDVESEEEPSSQSEEQGSEGQASVSMPSSKNSFQTRLDKIVKSFVPPKQQNQDHSQVGGSTTDECDGGVDDDQYSSSSSPVPSFNIHRGLGQEEEEVDVINSEENLEEWPNMTVSDEKTKNVLNNSLQGVSNDDFQTGMNSDVSHPYTYRCDGSEPSESGTEKTSIDVMEKNTSSNRKAAESVEKREKGETLRSATKARVVPPIVTESQQKPSTSLFGRILAKLTPSKTSGPNDARNGEKNEPVEIGQELLIADEPLTKESSIPTIPVKVEQPSQRCQPAVSKIRPDLDINLPPANEQQGSAQSNVVYSNAANVASTQKKKRTDVVFATATPLQAAPVSVKPAAPRLSVTDAPVRQATTNTPLIPERPAPTPNADRSSHATATGLQVQYIQIPRKYYPWIRGPYDRRLSQLLAKEGQNLVEVCFPPEGGDVSVKGPKAHASEVKKVYEKISEIYRKIYDQKKDIKEVQLKIAKSYHPLVCGQNGQVIHKILEETLVIIEVPPADSPSEIVTLRGFTEVSVDGVVIWLRDHARVPVDVVSESKEIRDKSAAEKWLDARPKATVALCPPPSPLPEPSAPGPIKANSTVVAEIGVTSVCPSPTDIGCTNNVISTVETKAKAMKQRHRRRKAEGMLTANNIETDTTSFPPPPQSPSAGSTSTSSSYTSSKAGKTESSGFSIPTKKFNCELREVVVANCWRMSKSDAFFLFYSQEKRCFTRVKICALSTIIKTLQTPKLGEWYRLIYSLGIKAPYSHIFVHELQHLLGSHPPTRLVSNELQFRVVATRNTETKLYESSLGRFTIPLDCYLITRQFLEVWIRVVRQGLDGREQLELAYVKLADGDSDADGQPDAEKWLPPQNTNQELNERALNDEEYAEYVRQRDVRDQRDILQHRQRTGAPVVKHHREALERDQVETMRSLQGQFCLLHPFRKHLNGKRSSSGSKKINGAEHFGGPSADEFVDVDESAVEVGSVSTRSTLTPPLIDTAKDLVAGKSDQNATAKIVPAPILKLTAITKKPQPQGKEVKAPSALLQKSSTTSNIVGKSSSFTSVLQALATTGKSDQNTTAKIVPAPILKLTAITKKPQQGKEVFKGPPSAPLQKSTTTSNIVEASSSSSMTSKKAPVVNTVTTTIKWTEVKYEPWLAKYLLGIKTRRFKELVPNRKNLNFCANTAGKITLNGPHEVVFEAKRLLEEEIANLHEQYDLQTVVVDKDKRGSIVGRNGAFIKQWDKDHVEIDVPTEYSDSNDVRIIGPKAAVARCRQAVVELLKRLDREKKVPVEVHHRYHAELIDSGRIRTLADQFPFVTIAFPERNDFGNNTVWLEGEEIPLARMKAALETLVREFAANNYENTVVLPSDGSRGPADYVRFLVGTQHSRERELRERFPLVRIQFPADPSVIRNIRLVGPKDDVLEVKRLMGEQIAELRDTMKLEVPMDSEYHYRFLEADAKLLKEIQRENGDCYIRIDRKLCVAEISGHRESIYAAQRKIEAILTDLKSLIVETLALPAKHRPRVISHIDGIAMENDVKIKYLGATIVEITGRRREAIASAKAAIQALIPVTERLLVPPSYRGLLIGPGGVTLRDLQTRNSVMIQVPPADNVHGAVEVTGPSGGVRACLAEINGLILSASSPRSRQHSFATSAASSGSVSSFSHHRQRSGSTAATARSRSRAPAASRGRPAAAEQENHHSKGPSCSLMKAKR